MTAFITKDVNKRNLKPLGRCALLQVLRAMTSIVTREEYSNPQGEGGLDDPACGCLLCRKGGKSGSHSPFATPNSDWLLQSKSPIRELPRHPHLSH